MKISRDVREYLFKEQLEIRVFLDKVNIINYKELGVITDKRVSVYHDNGRIVVTGLSLVVSRLLNNEILITGRIKNIELGD